MRVHLIKRLSVEIYFATNAQSKVPLINWLNVIQYVNWNKPQDIISTFNNADILGKGSERIVFNIGGNNYRMICKYYFGNEKVHLFVKWIGTHAEYSKLCKMDKQFDVSEY